MPCFCVFDCQVSLVPTAECQSGADPEVFLTDAQVNTQLPKGQLAEHLSVVKV